MRLLTLAVLAALLVLSAPALAAYDPVYEAQNFGKGTERAQNDYTPQFNALLARRGAENEVAAASILATDGPGRPFGRNFAGQLCWQKMNGCAGDVRLYDWASGGYGRVLPVLFTQRNGSTLSGHVWWTERGPAKRPGVVITNGSVQAPEELYWFGAQTLAKAGYVVLTWEPQGQGYSDTFGDGVDRNDGVPSQAGGPFYDGTEDALDFFFSSPERPYVPRPSCSTGTSHAGKQAARVEDGRSSAYNPLSGLLDPSRVGIIGQSLGAGAVSYVGQRDERVKTIVAWDNLRSSDSGSVPGCASAPDTRKPVAPRVPALGLAGDYPLGGGPKTSEPARSEKQAGYDALRRAGLDAGEIVIRGGGHFEYAYIPNPAFQATERGMDLVAWYTTAWMDRYVTSPSPVSAAAAAASCGRTGGSRVREAACARATSRRAGRRTGACACGTACRAAATSCGRAASTRRATSSASRARGTSARCTCAAADGTRRPAILRGVNVLGRAFGRRRYERPQPRPEDLERVDISRMIAIARERGDPRTEPEVVAALMLGADLTAERHHDADLRLRGAAAFEVCRRRLVDDVGEDAAARLLSESRGPIDEQGRIRRP